MRAMLYFVCMTRTGTYINIYFTFIQIIHFRFSFIGGVIKMLNIAKVNEKDDKVCNSII